MRYGGNESSNPKRVGVVEMMPRLLRVQRRSVKGTLRQPATDDKFDHPRGVEFSPTGRLSSESPTIQLHDPFP